MNISTTKLEFYNFNISNMKICSKLNLTKFCRNKMCYARTKLKYRKMIMKTVCFYKKIKFLNNLTFFIQAKTIVNKHKTL